MQKSFRLFLVIIDRALMLLRVRFATPQITSVPFAVAGERL